jgi:hypothetical protein
MDDGVGGCIVKPMERQSERQVESRNFFIERMRAFSRVSAFGRRVGTATDAVKSMPWIATRRWASTATASIDGDEKATLAQLTPEDCVRPIAIRANLFVASVKQIAQYRHFRAHRFR